jgi:hypothetical protein
MIKTFFVTNKLILILLLIGILYRLYLTYDGNFIFNMDNARDFVDVREMVELQKPRLIGPTSAIQGFFTGPAWYYLLSIPYILTNGDPYGAILMEFLLWAIGGFFLLKLASRYGLISTLVCGVGWVASNMILLATAYSFNPNPVTLLTPLFIYFLERYLTTKKIVYSVGTFFLGGLFFNFEMNFGIFIPLIVVLAILLSKKLTLFKHKSFWIGSLFFILCLLPQVLFEFKHNFLMTNSILNYLQNPPANEQPREFVVRLPLITNTFYSIIVPGFMNNTFFTKSLLLIFFVWVLSLIKNKNWHSDLLIPVLLSYIFIPFIGYVILPVTVNSWHLGGIVAASILLSGLLISKIFSLSIVGKVVGLILLVMFTHHSLNNILNYLKDSKLPNNDPALYKNEIMAIDYIFQRADGQNFKIYTYMPSIIDYPYQYLFWWRGLHKYGYVPKEYAYAQNVPTYIENKEKLPNGDNPPYEGLVFLLKQPDTRGDGHLWENQFKIWELKSIQKIGPYIIEERKEATISANLLQ